jgi:hypothetical protein
MRCVSGATCATNYYVDSAHKLLLALKSRRPGRFCGELSGFDGERPWPGGEVIGRDGGGLATDTTEDIATSERDLTLGLRHCIAIIIFSVSWERYCLAESLQLSGCRVERVKGTDA